MLHLSKLFLLAILVNFSTCQQKEPADLMGKCGFWESTKFVISCRSLAYSSVIYSLSHPDYQTNQKPTSENYKESSEICEKAKNCLQPFECEDLKTMRSDLMNQCDLMHYTNSDNKLCLKSFFREAYLAQFESEPSCLKEYSFVDNDSTKRAEAYREGKLCFIKYARERCTPLSIDFFNTDNYERFAEFMSKEELDDECKTPQNVLYSIQCRALMAEFNSRVGKLTRNTVGSDRSFMSQSAKICRDVQKCVTNSCFLNQDMKLLMDIEKDCRALDERV